MNEQTTTRAQSTPSQTRAPGGGSPAARGRRALRRRLRGASYEEGRRAVSPGPPRELPFRAEMERAFRVDLSGVTARTGAAEECAAVGARAYARGDQVVFGDRDPELATVAHETAHVVQHLQAGGAPSAGSGVSSSSDSAEVEAHAVAAQVAAGQQVEVSAPLTAGIHRLEGDGPVCEEPVPAEDDEEGGWFEEMCDSVWEDEPCTDDESPDSADTPVHESGLEELPCEPELEAEPTEEVTEVEETDVPAEADVQTTLVAELDHAGAATRQALSGADAAAFDAASLRLVEVVAQLEQAGALPAEVGRRAAKAIQVEEYGGAVLAGTTGPLPDPAGPIAGWLRGERAAAARLVRDAEAARVIVQQIAQPIDIQLGPLPLEVGRALNQILVLKAGYHGRAALYIDRAVREVDTTGMLTTALAEGRRDALEEARGEEQGLDTETTDSVQAAADTLAQRIESGSWRLVYSYGVNIGDPSSRAQVFDLIKQRGALWSEMSRLFEDHPEMWTGLVGGAEGYQGAAGRAEHTHESSVVGGAGYVGLNTLLGIGAWAEGVLASVPIVGDALDAAFGEEMCQAMGDVTQALLDDRRVGIDSCGAAHVVGQVQGTALQVAVTGGQAATQLGARADDVRMALKLATALKGGTEAATGTKLFSDPTLAKNQLTTIERALCVVDAVGNAAGAASDGYASMSRDTAEWGRLAQATDLGVKAEVLKTASDMTGALHDGTQLVRNAGIAATGYDVVGERQVCDASQRYRGLAEAAVKALAKRAGGGGAASSEGQPDARSGGGGPDVEAGGSRP